MPVVGLITSSGQTIVHCDENRCVLCYNVHDNHVGPLKSAVESKERTLAPCVAAA